jgi:acid stress-induced BolA-like protein IbaG/YrbA
MENLAPHTLKTYIENALECQLVRVDNADGRLSAQVVSPAFRDKSMVQQHQMLYGALGEHLRDELPALTLRTYTPEDWADRNGTV